MKYLDFGVSDPLSLTMGHPVIIRVSRLGIGPRPFAKAVTGIIVATGLWFTATANEHTADFAEFDSGHDFLLEAFYADDVKLDVKRVPDFTVKAVNSMIEVQADYIYNLDDFQARKSFDDIVIKCVNYTEADEIIYYRAPMTQGVLLGRAGDYIIQCRPGKEETRSTVTWDNVGPAIKQADLTDTDKARLTTAFQSRFNTTTE